TRASRRGSLKDASQLSVTEAEKDPGPIHLGGGAKLGIACFAISSRGGRSLSAQPASASATRKASRRRIGIASMQFRNQVVQIRAYAQDDLADDVQERGVLGVDRGVASGASG